MYRLPTYSDIDSDQVTMRVTLGTAGTLVTY